MNKKGKVMLGILSTVLLITPISAVIDTNEVQARNNSVNSSETQISQRDMEIFQRELKRELMRDPQFNNIVIQEEYGVKTQAAKYAAKRMKAKLYKIGSRKFNQYIQNAANKIPNKKARDFIKRHVNYYSITAILNAVANFEGNITTILENRFVAMGMNRWVAGTLSRTIVWVLL